MRHAGVFRLDHQVADEPGRGFQMMTQSVSVNVVLLLNFCSSSKKEAKILLVVNRYEMSSLCRNFALLFSASFLCCVLDPIFFLRGVPRPELWVLADPPLPGLPAQPAVDLILGYPDAIAGRKRQNPEKTFVDELFKAKKKL